MPTTKFPIPTIAKTALALANQQHNALVQHIGRQAVEALGLNPDQHISVDFDSGFITLEVPDPPQEGG